MTEAQRDHPYREWGSARSARATVTNFFGPNSPYLTHPLLTTERTSLEVDRLISWCENPPTSVLDVGCGFGRHCFEFASRGIAATGVDPSVALLDVARGQAATNNLDVEFVEASADTFVLGEGTFDLGISLFTSLGQIGDSRDDPMVEQSLANIARAIRGGGTLVIEVPERDRAVDALVREEQLGDTAVTRSFDPNTSVLTEQFTTPANTFDLAYKLFSKEELRDAVAAAGFTLTKTHDEAVQTPPFTFMTLVAERV